MSWRLRFILMWNHTLNQQNIFPHLLIMMRSSKMMNEDWRYSEDKLKLRGECLHILLNKFSYDDPNKVNYTTQDIYECAHDWVSQGNKISSGIAAYFQAYYINKVDTGRYV